MSTPVSYIMRKVGEQLVNEIKDGEGIPGHWKDNMGGDWVPDRLAEAILEATADAIKAHQKRAEKIHETG